MAVRRMRTALGGAVAGTGLRTTTRGGPVTEQLRGHTEELDPNTLGGFHVRWYQHAGGQPVGPFDRMDEVALYMREHGLDRPDEFLAPICDPLRR